MKKERERVLREERTYFLSIDEDFIEWLSSQTGLGMMVINTEENFFLWNEKSREILDFSPSHMTSKAWKEKFSLSLIDSDMDLDPEDFPIMQSLKKGKTIRNLGLWVKNRESDSRKYILLSSAPVKDHLGKTVGALALFKEREMEELYFSTLSRHVKDFILLCDDGGEIQFMSDSLEKALQITSEDWKGRHISFLFFQEEWDNMLKAHAESVDDKGLASYFEKCLEREDKKLWLEVSLASLNQSTGIKGWIIHAKDISERKAAEERLHEKNRQLEHFAHIVSHELRAPVANVLGLAAILELQPEFKGKEIFKMLSKVAGELDRLTRKASKTLDF